MQCATCGAVITDAANSCSECGSALRARPVGGGERRRLSVVFVDLAGSSALSEKLDLELLHELLQTYRAACAKLVKRYDGHVAQYLGDGILAYFGYPIAHEDAAIRALRAGLEIIEAVRGIRIHGNRLRVRIGVHSGVVVVGDVGDPQRSERLVVGEVPNIAERLQAIADVDSILISDATRQLLGGQFRLEDGGSRTLKDISRPLRVHRVLGRSGASSRFAARATAGLAPFVGRAREIAAMQGAWAESRAGSGRTILLRGEAGIGKSRLLGAAREGSSIRLREAFEVECSPYDANRALHPIAQMLERRLGLEDETSAIAKLELLERFTAGRGTAIKEALPLLAELLSIPTGERYATLDLAPPARRQRTLEILAGLLLHCPDGAPALLLIEDLHWADPSTLELVEILVARQTSAPLFILCTTRPELSVTWPPAPHWSEIVVEALPKDDARALIAGVTGGKPLPEEVSRQILARTGGVPLFVEAVTRTILETGDLQELEDRYELVRPLSADLIPATVHDSLMARIDQLGPDKPIAQLASAIGRTFRIDLLSHVASVGERSLRRAIDHLVELELIAPSSTDDRGSYTFKHALIQDAAYMSLLRSTRREVHAGIADALARRFPGVRESDPALLARHFEGAGQVEEAIECWMESGFQAQHASAEHECIASMRKALDLLETLPEDDPQRLEKETATHLALAPALMATQGWGSKEVEAVCQRARVLCERTHNEEGLFTVLWGLWTVLFVRGDHASALGAARALREMAQAGDNKILRVGASMAVGDTHYFRGEFREALEHAERGLALFDHDLERELVRTLQIPLLAVCSFIASQSLLFMGRAEEARRHHDRLVELVAALANPTCTAVGLSVALYSLYELRDLDRVEQLCEETYAVSEEEGFVFWATFMQVYRGWVWCMRGDSAAGIPEMYAGLEGFLRTQSLIAVPQMWLMIAEGHQAAGEFDEARKAVANGLRLAADNHERIYESHLHRVRGEIEIEEGQAQQGEATLRRAIEIAVAQDALYIKLRASLPLARLLMVQDRGREAHDLLRPLHATFTQGHDLADLIEARELLEALGP